MKVICFVGSKLNTVGGSETGAVNGRYLLSSDEKVTVQSVQIIPQQSDMDIFLTSLEKKEEEDLLQTFV